MSHRPRLLDPDDSGRDHARDPQGGPVSRKKYHVLAIAMSDSGSIVYYTREMTMTTERHVEPHDVGGEAEIMDGGRLTVTLTTDLTDPDDLLESWLVPGGVDALKLHLAKIVDEIGEDA